MGLTHSIEGVTPKLPLSLHHKNYKPMCAMIIVGCPYASSFGCTPETHRKTISQVVATKCGTVVAHSTRPCVTHLRYTMTCEQTKVRWFGLVVACWGWGWALFFLMNPSTGIIGRKEQRKSAHVTIFPKPEASDPHQRLNAFLKGGISFSSVEHGREFMYGPKHSAFSARVQDLPTSGLARLTPK